MTGCTGCHGDATRVATALNPELPAAPPKDTTGSSATTSAGVGAHQAHLTAGSLRNAMACTECHAAPGQGTHPSGTVDLAWGSLARPAAPPLLQPDQPHLRQLLPRGHARRRLPPDARLDRRRGRGHLRQLPRQPASVPHPVVAATASCGDCHPGSTRASVDPATHVNGTVNVTLSCTSCHGDANRAATSLNPFLAAAPPVDTKGNTATTARGVGAHQRHLVAGALSAGTACGECHATVPSFTHSNGVVEVAFGTLARTGSVTPAWNGSGCASSYCHGNFKNGTTTLRPQLDGACGECLRHLPRPPPGGTHPASAACETCHTGYTATTVNVANHVNGIVDVVGLSCTSCHGTAARVSVAGADLNQASAPPVDTAARDGRRGRHAPGAREPGRGRRGLQAGRLHRVPHQQHERRPLEQRRERHLRDRHRREPGQLRAHLRPGQRHDHPDHLRHLLPRLVAQRDDDARQRRLLDLERRRRRLRQLPQVASHHRQPPQRRGAHHLRRAATAAPSTRPASSTSPAACT